MSRPAFFCRLLLASTVALLAVSKTLAFDPPTFTWSGSSLENHDFYNGYNWVGGIAPPNDGTARIIFGPVDQQEVSYYYGPYEIFVEGIRFNGITSPYRIYGSYDTTHIGAGGIVYAPAAPIRSYFYDAFQLRASQTWDITSGQLRLFGSISDTRIDPETEQTVVGNHVITKTGAGALALRAHESFDAGVWWGGMIVKDGSLVLGARREDGVAVRTNALGNGTITFDSTGGGTPVLTSAPDLNYDDEYFSENEFNPDGDLPLIIDNHLNIKGTFTSRNRTEVELRGEVTLMTNATIDSRGELLSVTGGIGDDFEDMEHHFKLTIDARGAVLLDPYETSNTYSGGTHVENGILVFANDQAVPDIGQITASANGYVGYGSPTSVSSGFLNNFDRANFFGSLGFDTESHTPILIESNIDMTGFASTARLGSASAAILGGTITPQGANYRFGGGGGTVVVNSLLTGARGVEVDSPAALPLTVVLQNNDSDFSGAISAKYSAVVLADGVVGNALQLDVGGYIGTQGYNLSEGPFTPQSFVDRFAGNTAHGVIGFDAAVGSRLVSAPLDLSNFTGNVYLGTSTPGYFSDGVGGGAVLSGVITTGTDGTAPYRFAGYKGGFLRVESTLSGSAGVVIGDPTSPGTFADFVGQEYSKVGLFGDNSSLTGDVTFHGGLLYVGHNNALGTGKLIVQGMTLPTEWQALNGVYPAPALVSAYGVTVSNEISLQTRLSIEGWSGLHLAGKITGPGSLYVEEDSLLVLSNAANDFSGGIYVSHESALQVDADTATGTGKLAFGYSYGSAYFSTLNPVIHGLESDNYGAYIGLDASLATLEVRQNFDSTYRGEIDAYDGGRVLKTGTGSLRFEELSLYSAGRPDGQGNNVGLEVQQGTVVFGDDVYIAGSSVVKLNGGTLRLDGGAQLDPHYIYASVVAQSGSLIGHGDLGGAVTIGGTALISPGLAGAEAIGWIGMAHLNMAAGGSYRWQISSAVDPSAHDMLFVYGSSTLVVESTPEDPFTIVVESLTLAGTAGALAGFDPANAYSWIIAENDNISGFDPAKFEIDATNFTAHNSLGNTPAGNGHFWIGQNGTNLMLNFTPVPEPSTYVLIGFGLGVVGFGAWRKRRRL